MKTLKKITSLILAVMMLCSLTACHPKDEVAVSAGDYTVTSAVYSYYLVVADSEAKKIVDEAAGETSATPDYYSQTVNGKPFEEYVRQAALDSCKAYIARQKMCDEAGVKLTAQQNTNVELNAETYWYSYGYYANFEPNGVSLSTYTKILKNEARYDLYFEQLYGKGGDREIPADEMTEYFSEHYAAVWMPVDHDYSSTENGDAETIVGQYESYKEMLENGASFDEVVESYNGGKNNEEDESSSSDADSSEDVSSSDSSEETSSENTSSDEAAPKDEDITILTDNTKTYEATVFAKFSEVKDLEVGKAAVIHDADNKKIYVVMKKDFFADEYYAETYDAEVRETLKKDEFDAELEKIKEALELDINNYAIKQFKIKKITYAS